MENKSKNQSNVVSMRRVSCENDSRHSFGFRFKYSYFDLFAFFSSSICICRHRVNIFSVKRIFSQRLFTKHDNFVNLFVCRWKDIRERGVQNWWIKRAMTITMSGGFTLLSWCAHESTRNKGVELSLSLVFCLEYDDAYSTVDENGLGFKSWLSFLLDETVYLVSVYLYLTELLLNNINEIGIQTLFVVFVLTLTMQTAFIASTKHRLFMQNRPFSHFIVLVFVSIISIRFVCWDLIFHVFPL